MTLLETINDPTDLRKLKQPELTQLADEMRQLIVDSVSKTGGHLSSNLGTVELTIALHHAFNTPEDRLIWDVGHQTYPHKILTGRRDQMSTLRQFDGISGFPKRDESEYDSFGTAHSSTSISAALGMALAASSKGENRYAIAVIGDGAITGGMAFEALNNAGVYEDINLVVILNDNDMSISPPVGALNRYFSRLMSGKFYEKAKTVGKTVLPKQMVELAKRFEEHAKSMILPTNVFEEFGFHYSGPIDGHNIDTLLQELQQVKERSGPQFLHVVTKKGQGYKLAEADPTLYHGAGSFSPEVGIRPVESPKLTYTEIFGQWLCDVSEQDEKLIGITPAMREGSGMVEFEKQCPNRYYDVGIAEQHAVTFAAGMACEGYKPVVAIYSTFMQRAYDQLIHDVALQNLDVTFALDRAGLVGADGATHAGNYDLAFMRCIPNMVIMAPSDENECRRMLTTAYQFPGPASVRYPRGAGVGVAFQRDLETLEIGKGLLRREGCKVAILAFGSMLAPSLRAAEELDASVADMRFVKPIDTELILQLANSHDLLVTIEEGCIMGGAGSAVSETLSGFSIKTPVMHLGLPDTFIDHGDASKLLEICGLDSKGIVKSIQERLLKDEPKLVVNN